MYLVSSLDVNGFPRKTDAAKHIQANLYQMLSMLCVAGRLPVRNPELDGTEAVESSAESDAPSREEWEAWVNTHNKLSEEMNETKHTLLTLQELVGYDQKSRVGYRDFWLYQTRVSTHSGNPGIVTLEVMAES